MINIAYIKKFLEENSNVICFTFDYKGKPCGIDPWSYGKQHYNVWYGEEDFVADSWEAVLKVKLFDGKRLPEIVDKITDYDS